MNTVTFVDEGRRFVSTSDDKTIRVWEFGISVQIKYIADPSLHSIPAVAVHPNSQWLIGTSLDNQIVTYAARDRFRQNRKKIFKVSLCSYLHAVIWAADFCGPRRRGCRRPACRPYGLWLWARRPSLIDNNLHVMCRGFSCAEECMYRWQEQAQMLLGFSLLAR